MAAGRRVLKENNRLGELEVSRATARAKIIEGGVGPNAGFNFIKENGSCKIDLTAIFPVANELMKAVMTGKGTDEDAFLFALLKLLSERRVAEDVWQPFVG